MTRFRIGKGITNLKKTPQLCRDIFELAFIIKKISIKQDHRKDLKKNLG